MAIDFLVGDGSVEAKRHSCCWANRSFAMDAHIAVLPQSYPNYKTVHRRFQTWCRDEVLRRVLMDVANELRERCNCAPVLSIHSTVSSTWRVG